MNDQGTIVKRFIAGAICPKCSLADKTVVYSIGEQDYTECVRCGFKRFADNKRKKTTSKKAKIIWLKQEKQD
jgi:uncharacterized metal-binding protein (TIGR02443 family)